MWMHASLVAWAGNIDGLSMYVYAAFLVAYTLRRLVASDVLFWIVYGALVVVFEIVSIFWTSDEKSLVLILILVALYLAGEVCVCITQRKFMQGRVLPSCCGVWRSSVSAWRRCSGCCRRPAGPCAIRAPSSSRMACFGIPWPGSWRCCSTSIGVTRKPNPMGAVRPPWRIPRLEHRPAWRATATLAFISSWSVGSKEFRQNGEWRRFLG
jgi:hypothetical protein